MDDKRIVELYWARSEAALTETGRKYGRYCHRIAYNILYSEEDAEECVNDTWLRAWNAMPPRRPQTLASFLGKITRNLSLNRYEQRTAAKRGGGQVPLVLEELEECIPASGGTEQLIDELALAEVLNRFLAGLPGSRRTIFLRRYWYFCTIQEIASDLRISESKVKMTLLRARNELRQVLEQEGIVP